VTGITKNACLIRIPIFMGHPYFNGMWLGVAPRMDMKETYVLKRLDFVFKILITILGSIVKINEGTYMTIIEHGKSSLRLSIKYSFELRKL
jgi:hypothetical protein